MRDIKFLSYAFGRRNGKCQYRLHPDSIKKMKDKIRELTGRSNGWGYEYRKQRLTWYIRGWSNYFSLAGYRPGLEEWDEPVAPPNPHVYLEIVEESEDEVS